MYNKLTFRPSRAPESRGTLPSFIRLLSKIRPIRRSPSLDGCHVTGCYKVRATTHLLFNNLLTARGQTRAKKTTVSGIKGHEGSTIGDSTWGKMIHTNSDDLLWLLSSLKRYFRFLISSMKYAIVKRMLPSNFSCWRGQRIIFRACVNLQV